MTENTPQLNLPYPDGTDGPDGAGQIAALALAIDGAMSNHVIDYEAALGSGCGYDNPSGVSLVTKFGPFRIVHFSVFRGAGIGTNFVFLTLNLGNRPPGTVFGNGIVYDSGALGVAEFQMDANGACNLVVSQGGDVGSDGVVQAVRGTFTYLATH